MNDGSIGPFEIRQKLATGGMAELFLGSSDKVACAVVKRILPALSDEPDFRVMFEQEARVALSVSHPCVIRTFEYAGGSTPSQPPYTAPYIVMEYVEGMNLRQLLSRRRKSNIEAGIGIDASLFIVMQIALGLEAIHTAVDVETGRPLAAIHRDICPPNILLGLDGTVKLIDFGIVKSVLQPEMTAAHVIKGKFGYMSPEVASGDRPTQASDLYSLGVILWELLANDRLFVRADEMETLMAAQKSEVPRLEIEEAPLVAEILGRLATREAVDRFGTAREAALMLHRALRQVNPFYSSHDLAELVAQVSE